MGLQLGFELNIAFLNDYFLFSIFCHNLDTMHIQSNIGLRLLCRDVLTELNASSSVTVTTLVFPHGPAALDCGTKHINLKLFVTLLNTFSTVI
jgi:hypothetical protein